MNIVNNLQVSVPFTDLITQIPNYTRFMKDILTRKYQLNSVQTMAFPEECNALSQGTLPIKNEDPGSFSISCLIGDVFIDKALCDLGASVSVMPYSICTRINMGKIESTLIIIQMTDRSVKRPIGILKDVPVKVGKFFIPVDFVIMDIPGDSRTPIILWRPFLYTADAVIKVGEGTITLRVETDEITFNLSKTLSYPMLESPLCFIDTIDTAVQDMWPESHLRDPLDALMCLEDFAGNETDVDAYMVEFEML